MHRKWLFSLAWSESPLKKNCQFESGKCEKEVKKLLKFEYLKNKRSCLDEIKTHFSWFLKAYPLSGGGYLPGGRRLTMFLVKKILKSLV